MHFLVHAWGGSDGEARDRAGRTRRAHLEFAFPLVGHGEILVGGALLDGGGEMIGWVLITSFAGRDELEDWLGKDPYVAEHVWHDVEVHPFRPVVGKWLSPSADGETSETSGNSERVVLRAPDPGDYGWVVGQHGEVYWREYGWDETFEALVARIVGDYAGSHDPTREHAWIAEVRGKRAGCVFCVRKDDATAQLRLLLVEPWARGQGVGTRLVAECISFARAAGYRRIALWTNDVLADARRIYERAGFILLEEEQHTSFGHRLVGQSWVLEL